MTHDMLKCRILAINNYIAGISRDSNAYLHIKPIEDLLRIPATYCDTWEGYAKLVDPEPFEYRYGWVHNIKDGAMEFVDIIDKKTIATTCPNMYIQDMPDEVDVFDEEQQRFMFTITDLRAIRKRRGLSGMFEDISRIILVGKGLK
jgi:hypothetical protein